MTTTTRLDRTLWQPYFDHVSKMLAGKRVEIEVDSLQLGSQLAAEWLPLFGVTYDKQDDLIAIMAEDLDHMIRQPRDVFIDAIGSELLSMEVIDGDGASQIIKFKTPLLLPAA